MIIHSWDSKVDNFANSLFLLIIIRSSFLGEIRRSVCMPKSNRSLCVSFFRTAAWLCIYHLFVWLNLNFLHISQWITLPTQSCLLLYSSVLISLFTTTKSCCLYLSHRVFDPFYFQGYLLASTPTICFYAKSPITCKVYTKSQFPPN